MGDAAGFLSAATALARSPETLRWMGAEAGASVQELGWDRVVDRFVALLAASAARTTERSSR
jgi:hypothetical protein